MLRSMLTAQRAREGYLVAVRLILPPLSITKALPNTRGTVGLRAILLIQSTFERIEVDSSFS